MTAFFNGAALALLAAIWSYGLPSQAGGQRHSLLPDWPDPVPTPSPPPPTAPTSVAVRWGMPGMNLFPRTRCPVSPDGSWTVLGRDGDLIHIMAAYTNQLDGCVQVHTHGDPYENITKGKYHVYGEGMYWAPQMVDRVRYLYPHAPEPLCFMIRRADFVKREIFAAFVPGVYFLIGLNLLIFILILRFVFKLDTIQAVLEATDTFLTGSFADSRRPLMIWGSIFSLIVLNSFSGVFTSFLTVPKRGYEVNTLEEMTQHYDFAFVAPYMRQAFLSKVDRSDNPKLFALFDGKMSLKKMQEYRYPDLNTEKDFRVSRLILARYIELRQIKECMWTSVFVSFVTAKDWSGADHYDRLLMRLGQAGIVSKAGNDEWRNYSLYYKKYAAADPPPDPPKLSLGHFVEAFIILGVGAVAGLITFSAELAPSLWARLKLRTIK